MRVTRLATLALLAATTALAAPTFDDATKDAPPVKNGAIGTKDPMAGAMVSSDGRWLVLCQARTDTDKDGKLDVEFEIHGTYGDALASYLVLGSGPGMEIQYPAARSADDRWLAVVRNGKLELIENATYHRWVIDADIRNDMVWTTQKNMRFISIAGNGSRLVYAKHGADGDSLVIRELPSMTERSVPVKGTLWRATVDGAGHWASVTTMRKDTDKNGKVEWPGGPQVYSLAQCGADTIHAGNFQPDAGDKVTTQWLDLTTGALSEDVTVIGVVGDQLLHRTKKDVLVLGTEPITDASCHARVAGVYASPPRVAITCGKAKDQYVDAMVTVVGPGGFKKVTQHETSRDNYWERFDHDKRFLVEFGDTSVVDMSTGDEIALPGEVQSYTSERVVVPTKPGGTTFVGFELATQKTTPLATGTGNSVYTDDLFQIDQKTYNYRTGKVVPDEVMMADNAGRTLVGPKNAKTQPGHAGPGPLHWEP